MVYSLPLAPYKPIDKLPLSGIQKLSMQVNSVNNKTKVTLGLSQ